MKMITSRRNFLKLNGATIALPFLHSLSSAFGSVVKSNPAPARRLVMMYAPNGLVRRCFFPGEETIATMKGFVGGFDSEKFKSQKRIPNKPGI